MSVFVSPPMPAPATGVRGLRVLLVEDEWLIRVDTADMLSDIGCVVTEAGTGAEGLAELARARFDMLVTDVDLGDGVGGVELARMARATQPSLRVVFATAQDDVPGAGELGATVLCKPYTLDLIRTAVFG